MVHPRFPVALLGLAFAATATVTACGGATPAQVTAPSNSTAEQVAPVTRIAGRYVETHPVMMVCHGGDDGWCEEEADDTLTVVDVPGGAIDVTIDLVQTNAHTCTFEGRLVPAPGGDGGRRWVHRSDDPVAGACALTLEQTASEVRLAADGCRYYCGARASLDATFSYPPRG